MNDNTCSHCLRQFSNECAVKSHIKTKVECREAKATIISSDCSLTLLQRRAEAEKAKQEQESKDSGVSLTDETETSEESLPPAEKLTVHLCACNRLFVDVCKRHFGLEQCSVVKQGSVASDRDIHTCAKCYDQFVDYESCHLHSKKCGGREVILRPMFRNDLERKFRAREDAKKMLAAHKKISAAGSEVIFITRSSPPLSLDFFPSLVCALDCEGVNLSATGELCLLQLAFANGPRIVYDICDLTSSALGSSTSSVDALSGRLSTMSLVTPCLPNYLVDFLENDHVIKLVHDVHNDSAALFKQYNVNLRGVIDTQLCYEILQVGTPFASLDDVLKKFHPLNKKHPLKTWAKEMIKNDPAMWKKRPLAPKLLEYAVHDVILLAECEQAIRRALVEHHNQEQQVHGELKSTEDGWWSLLLKASELRTRDAATHSEQGRQMCFLPPSWMLGSQELAIAFHTSYGIPAKIPQKLHVDTDLNQLLRLLPMRFRQNGKLGDSAPTFKLRDIVLDFGRRPSAFFGSERIFLSDDATMLVTYEDLKQMVEGLGESKFGPDNRAGINGCLHRISAMRNKQRHVIGLTLRVGRSVTGNADMIMDLVGSLTDLRCVLILGVPGTGKTTIVREIARLLANRYNVCVVDTSNEICGDGDAPHPCVGLARRMMVPKIEEQGSVMVECLQNHTPDVILVDEIGRRPEVDAARTVKQRGVRLVASAHGDLTGLVKNHVLNGLVGGVESITLGDEAAKRNHGSKLQATRQGLPVFDAVVELQKDDLNSWHVVKDVASAVDCILAGKSYNAQQRRREEDGSLRVRLVKVKASLDSPKS